MVKELIRIRVIRFSGNFFLRLYLFLERGEGEGERDTLIGCLSHTRH